jgi:uncharacterized membrane protein YfcA
VSALPDAAGWAVVLAGALTAGFITGLSGFGTALVASGFWYFALPAQMVPPLAAMAAMAGQMVGLASAKVRAHFDWRRLMPFVFGALPGVAVGVALLNLAAPDTLRSAVGAMLVLYAGWQFSGWFRPEIGGWGGRPADAAVGAGAGLMSGFAALSGPIVIIWLQLRGGPAVDQRAVYQPFNLVILSVSALAMAVAGRIDLTVLTVLAVCVPLSLTGAVLGVRAYHRVSDALFRRLVLGLLLASGLGLLAQAVLKA